MGKGGAGNQSENGDPGIGIPFSGEDRLPQGTATEKSCPQADEDHTEEVPEMIGVGHRLPLKSPAYVAKDQIAQECGSKEGCHPAEEVSIPDEKKITPCADKAEPRPLRQDAYPKSGKERYRECRVHRARPLLARKDESRLKNGQE